MHLLLLSLEEWGKPSNFFIRFLMDSVEYEYSFSMNQTEIITEYLYYYPNGRRSMVFSRDEQYGTNKKDVYDFRSVIRRPFDVAANTSRKTLFVSRASQMDRDIAKDVFRYFMKSLYLIISVYNSYSNRKTVKRE